MIDNTTRHKARNPLGMLVAACAVAGLLVLLLAAGATAGGQWSEGGVPLNTRQGQGGESLLSDSAGGCFSAWYDSEDSCIYAQHLDSAGKALWGTTGKRVNEPFDSCYETHLASDGKGGILVAWCEYDGFYFCKAQRLNSVGQRIWGDSGLEIFRPDQQYMVSLANGIVGDGQGGGIFLTTCSNGKTLISRVSAGGSILWGHEVSIRGDVRGNGIFTSPGGFIVGWTAAGTGFYNLYAQRFDYDGVPVWGTGDVQLSSAQRDKSEGAFTSDGAGGLIGGWIQPRTTNKALETGELQPYVQRISASGARMWGDDGKLMSTTRAEMHEVRVTSDGSGGALVAWLNMDERKIYGQKVSAPGAICWNPAGVLISGGGQKANRPVLVPDGSGGMVVAYETNTSSIGTSVAQAGEGRYGDVSHENPQVHVQQMLAGGKKCPGWGPDGALLVPASISDNTVSPVACTDGTGGAIVIFRYLRQGKGWADLYAQRMKPTTSVWYLAEGSTAWGFNTLIAIQNPNTSAAEIRTTYMLPGGKTIVRNRELAAASQTTIATADDMKFATDFSTKVECLNGLPIGVERTMNWQGAGAPVGETHASIGVNSPADDWYLAEGCSGYGFETWLLVQNPNDIEATCDFTYMIEGGTPKNVTRKIPARSRQSFNMSEDVGEQSAATMIDSDVPVIVERSMYRNNRRAGHETVAASCASTNYYLAEGTTAWGFTTYVLVQNPNSTPCFVSLTYMTASGPKSMPPFAMPAFGRATVKVNDQLPNTDFSTQVHSDKPIVAERAMYWPGNNPAYGEAMHDTIGLISPASMFYFPAGEASQNAETFTLVQNPTSDEVKVKVTYMRPSGKDNVTFQVTIPALSRITLNMADRMPEGPASACVEVVTPGGKIMAEHSMYWNDRSAGSCTIGGASD